MSIMQKEEIVEIVGEANVFDSSDVIDGFSSDESLVEPIKPSLVVQPKTNDEVQKIVQWANRTKTPLIPVSSEAPHFYGMTVPSVQGAVIVDLHGMNKILGINRQHRMAYVEPGVKYGELQSALAKEGLTLSTSLAPRASKSVMGSVLEIEPRLNPRHQWAYSDPLRCLEVIWGDGNRMFTGEAAGAVPDLQKQWEKDIRQIGGVGPMQLDLYRFMTAAQGTMGIATWTSLRCEVLPQVHKLYFASANKLMDLLDFTYRILRIKFGDELLIVNRAYLASLLGKTADEVQALQKQLPAWAVLVGIAGREMLPLERVAYQEKDIAEIAREFNLKLTSSIPGANGAEVLGAILQPSDKPYWKQRYKGAFQDIFFVTTLDKTPEFASTMFSLAEKHGYPNSDVGVYIQPQHMGTSVHCEFHLPYAQADRNQVKELFFKASEKLFRQGAFFSRPYGAWSKLQYDMDSQNTVALKKVKDIFDPNSIMNPGKLCHY